MFKRFALFASPGDIYSYFELAEEVSVPVRYNISPTKQIAVVIEDEDLGRNLKVFRWGLVPNWIKGDETSRIFPNAEAENAAERAAFRVPFQRRRCLIPMNGFYGWHRGSEQKQPYYFKMKDDSLMGIAGLWDQWNSPAGKIYYTCAVVTTEGNLLVQKVHKRMPAIIKPESYKLWLGSVTSKNLITNLLKPYSHLDMTSYPVGFYVDRPKNDGPECIEKVFL